MGSRPGWRVSPGRSRGKLDRSISTVAKPAPAHPMAAALPAGPPPTISASTSYIDHLPVVAAVEGHHRRVTHQSDPAVRHPLVALPKVGGLLPPLHELAQLDSEHSPLQRPTGGLRRLPHIAVGGGGRPEGQDGPLLLALGSAGRDADGLIGPGPGPPTAPGLGGG